MTESSFEVEGVPARLYAAEGARGLLLFGHGGAHGKDSPRFVELCRRYAEQTGLAVVCIDAVDHGDRKPADVAPGLPRAWHSTNVERMVHDWRRTAETLATDHGPAVAYVGFSMGSIFGVPTVAALPTIRAAVFAVGGIPDGEGVDDPELGPTLLRAAAGLDHAEVLMVNQRDDDFFSNDGSFALFDAFPGKRKRLMLWPGDHDDVPDEAIAASVAFLNEHV